MSSVIRLLRNTTTGATPLASGMQTGQLAINTTDQRVFTKTTGGAIVKIADAAILADTLTNTSANQYGILGNAAVAANVDTAFSTGFYAVASAATGTKPAGYTAGTLYVSNSGATSSVTQMFLPLDGTDDGSSFVRRYLSGAWGAWHKIVTLDNTGTNFVRTISSNAPDSAGNFIISSQRNKLANAEFKRFSKGNPTAGALSSAFVCDHWWMTSAGATVTQVTSATNVPSTATNLSWQETSGTGTPVLNQNIESARTLQGNPVTFSMMATSSKVMTCQPALIQKFGTGGSSNVTTALSTVALPAAGAWTRYLFTGTLPSTSGKTFGTDDHLCLQIGFGAAPGTFTFQCTEMQLEYGGFMGFERLRPTDYDAFCNRYFERRAHASGIFGWSGNLGNTQTGGATESFVPKYKAPTPTITVISSSNFAATAPVANAITTSQMRWTTPASNQLLGGQSSIAFNMDLDAEIPVLP